MDTIARFRFMKNRCLSGLLWSFAISAFSIFPLIQTIRKNIPVAHNYLYALCFRATLCMFLNYTDKMPASHVFALR